jgi:anti-sigma factor RsiW
MSTDEFAMYDAAYVLGALSPVDRREFEDHLKGCASCAKSVGELAGLPGLMSKVSVEQLTAEVEAPPETLLPSLARAVRRERGRRRITVGAAAVAAACLIVVGAMALTETAPPNQPSAAPSSAAPSGSAKLALSAVVPSPVTASAQLVDMAWGTRVDLTCWYNAKEFAPAGGFPYALVVIDRSGAVQQVATWRAPPGRELTLVGTSSLARRDIAAIEVRRLSGLVILRLWT